MASECGFSLFLSLWNQMQGYKTPHIHFKISEWLEQAWVQGDTRLLLMAFRACGKSTLVGLFVVWVLYKDPNLRILILSAEGGLATKMVSNIRRIMEKHPLVKDLKPRVPEQWSSDRFMVNRTRELRDPSVLARGITSNITGSRADLIICDDVEVPNTCDSADKRAGLRERLAETYFILVPGGTILYVGTPHTYYSIYANDIRHEIGEEQTFLNGYECLKVPILNAQGESVWSERFSESEIEDQRVKTGPNKFRSQMMLEPVNILDGRLNPELLRFYDEGITCSEVQKTPVLTIGSKKMVSASAWWDPSFGREKSDHSVVAIVFSDVDGNKYIQKVSYLNVNESSGVDEATQQCLKVVQLVKNYYVPSIALEINGIGKFLPSILRRELGRAGVACSVLEFSSRRAKSLRIMEAFDAPMAARALYAHKSVTFTPFVTEMQEWQPETTKTHDDGLDAVAGALSLEPVRIKRIYGGVGAKWGTSGQAFKAKTII